jgi:hypothetical protein
VCGWGAYDTQPAKVTPFDGACRKGLGRFRPEK